MLFEYQGMSKQVVFFFLQSLIPRKELNFPRRTEKSFVGFIFSSTISTSFIFSFESFETFI